MQEVSEGSMKLAYLCPGCRMSHELNLGPDKPNWQWDGNAEAPTLHPSVNINMAATVTSKSFVCHSWVRNGMIEFLNDSTHALAGKTVPLVEFDTDDL